MSDQKNCHVEPVEKALDRKALFDATAAYLAVWGMGCPRCATRVRNGLLSLEGVLLAEIQLERGLACVAFNPQTTTPDDLVAAVAAAGNDRRHHYRAQIIEQMPAKQVLRL